MLRVLLGVVLLLMPALAWAQTLPRFEDCLLFHWKYDKHPELAEFRLYVSRTSGQYAFGKAGHEAPGGWQATQPSLTSLVLFALCDVLSLYEPGIYYAVLTATTTTGQESLPSNEISFTFGDPSTFPDPSPVPTPTPQPRQPSPTPVVQLPTPPPPIGSGGRPPLPTPPGSGSGGRLSDHPMWNGTLGR